MIEEHKAFIALDYIKGKISKKELVRTLGKKDAGDIEFIAKTTKKGLRMLKNTSFINNPIFRIEQT